LCIPSDGPTVRRGTFDDLVSQACGSVPAPPQITEWVADKFGAITKAHEKELEGRKRKHDPTHQGVLSAEPRRVSSRVAAGPDGSKGFKVQRTMVDAGTLQQHQAMEDMLERLRRRYAAAKVASTTASAAAAAAAAATAGVERQPEPRRELEDDIKPVLGLTTAAEGVTAKTHLLWRSLWWCVWGLGYAFAVARMLVARMLVAPLQLLGQAPAARKGKLRAEASEFVPHRALTSPVMDAPEEPVEPAMMTATPRRLDLKKTR
jgi:hypothetical protein